MDNLKIGLFLQSLRKSKGITQAELAENFNISNKTVSKWECGETLPEIPLLKSLAEFYGVTVDEILNGESNKTINVVFKEDKKEKLTYDRKIHLPLILSITISYVIFLISLAIGYGVDKATVSGFVGLLGGILGISTYFVSSYIFDNKFLEHKNNMVITLLINIFEIVLSILIIISNKMIEPKILISDILRTLSVYGFISLLILSLINKKYELIGVFIFLIILNLFLNFVPIYSYVESNFSETEHYCSGYYNVFRSWYGLFIIPLLLNVIIFIIAIFTLTSKISKDYLNITIFIMLFAFVLVSSILKIDAPKTRHSSHGYRSYNLFKTRNLSYMFVILYLPVFGFLYKKSKELILDTSIFVLINLLLFVLVFNYDEAIVMTYPNDEKYYYEYLTSKSNTFRTVLMATQLIAYLTSTTLFIIFKKFKKKTYISYILLIYIFLAIGTVISNYIKCIDNQDGFDDDYILLIVLGVIYNLIYVIIRIVIDIIKSIKNKNGQIE